MHDHDATTGCNALITPDEAFSHLMAAWPLIVEECRATLGGELHYQAVVYHCLRSAGVPRGQLGMNVKQWIESPVSSLFQSLDLKKHEAFRGGFEPIPDVVLFGPGIEGDWRRRRRTETLAHMLMAIEVKASERAGSRLSRKELIHDILKLAAHREEVRHRGGDMHVVMMVIDTAPLAAERMTTEVLTECADAAAAQQVSFLYAAPATQLCRCAVGS